MANPRNHDVESELNPKRAPMTAIDVVMVTRKLKIFSPYSK
jgi:hypothetical protein